MKVALMLAFFFMFCSLNRLILLFLCAFVAFSVVFQRTFLVHFSVEAVDSLRRSDRDNIVTSLQQPLSRDWMCQKLFTICTSGRCARQNWMYVYAFLSDDSLSCRAVLGNSIAAQWQRTLVPKHLAPKFNRPCVLIKSCVSFFLHQKKWSCRCTRNKKLIYSLRFLLMASPYSI